MTQSRITLLAICLAMGVVVATLVGIVRKLAIDHHLPWQSAEANRARENVAALENQEETARAVAIQQSNITFQEALQIAEAEIGGKAYSMERETENGKPVIEVGIDGQEVFVDAETGKIVLIDDLRQGDREDIAEITAALELQQLATITVQQALQVAESFAGGQAHTVDLENEEGSLVYEVVIELQEVYVDAGNGQVLFTETVGQTDDDDGAQPKGSIQVPTIDSGE